MKLRVVSKLLVPCVAVFGLTGLSFLLGAVVMFFELPTSDFLEKAFLGAKAWQERNEAAAQEPLFKKVPPASLSVDKPDLTSDGFTLYATELGAQALLMDMRGKVVHRWQTAFSKVWPNPTHVRKPVKDDKIIIFGCHLFPNGDLLAVLHGFGDTPYGYGLVKLDKDSNILWRYSANVHHDVDVREDGTILAVTQKVVDPPREWSKVSSPCLVDYVVVLSPRGEELQKLAILDAFRDSPFALLLSLIESEAHEALQGGADNPQKTAFERGDILHTNFVRALPRSLAPKFSMFKPGQVLISIRQLDLLAVLDLERRAVVWAARGPWRSQHDAQFLDNGNLLLFDNLGTNTSSRVLEYDPMTRSFPWSYPGPTAPSFLTRERGMAQRLSNGNTLIVNSADGRLVEVTHAGEMVWYCSCQVHVTSGRRFAASELSFLPEGTKPRP